MSSNNTTTTRNTTPRDDPHFDDSISSLLESIIANPSHAEQLSADEQVIALSDAICECNISAVSVLARTPLNLAARKVHSSLLEQCHWNESMWRILISAWGSVTLEADIALWIERGYSGAPFELFCEVLAVAESKLTPERRLIYFESVREGQSKTEQTRTALDEAIQRAKATQRG